MSLQSKETFLLLRVYFNCLLYFEKKMKLSFKFKHLFNYDIKTFYQIMIINISNFTIKIKLFLQFIPSHKNKSN